MFTAPAAPRVCALSVPSSTPMRRRARRKKASAVAPRRSARNRNDDDGTSGDFLFARAVASDHGTSITAAAAPPSPGRHGVRRRRGRGRSSSRACVGAWQEGRRARPAASGRPRRSKNDRPRPGVQRCPGRRASAPALRRPARRPAGDLGMSARAAAGPGQRPASS